MAHTFREKLFFLLLCLSVPKGGCRHVQDNQVTQDDLFSVLNLDLKRELSEAPLYRRPLRESPVTVVCYRNAWLCVAKGASLAADDLRSRSVIQGSSTDVVQVYQGCLDMLALEGQFTFTATSPQRGCAAFFITEPNKVLSLVYDHVDIDCGGGDFIKVFDGWVMKGQRFPSLQDHPLPLSERYVDYCGSEEQSRRTAVRSSQNVFMLFFHIRGAGDGFTVTVRQHVNPFPCNIISQTPEGRFTMVVPQQHRNCSFSIIYPVQLRISDFSLGHHSDSTLSKMSVTGCSEAGDFVELLGGSGLDTSRMSPIAELCSSFTGPTQMQIGCDNTVVRLISTGRFVNSLTFSYNLLDHKDLQRIKLNSMDGFCL